MNSEVKAMWLKALRNGEYKQTSGRLKKVDGKEESFCCLGVLCDLYAKEHPLSEGWKAGSYHHDSSYFLGNNGYLPMQVMEWAGLKSCNPVVNQFGDNISLAGLNDSFNFGFSKIADIIEANL